ncbi:hypothetical protein G3T14_20550 [Methylobacterium sp. BTF04]|uniref:hypothetical protein n=1 Tax=Methylobacterium sp. BTF04 TaxID=2708300 RepID=UPI0013D3600D|nr:hypothetical protein [Methylobacterium sp. BTF04]NEU14493.1 hypothetical protein [Methylobacterium sp. BTF04]
MQTWIAERWDSSIFPLSREEGARIPLKEANGWYDDVAVYISTNRIVEAAGGALKEAEIARALKRQKLIAKTKSAKHLYVTWIPMYGAVKAYALSRKAFGRTTLTEPALSVQAQAGDPA